MMQQIQILSGIYSDANSDYRVDLPTNLIPVPSNSGVSQRYLRPSYGIDQIAEITTGVVDRGAIEWNGTAYRVIGNILYRADADGGLFEIGQLEPDENFGNPFFLSGYVQMDYSFDTLAITSATGLYLFTPFRDVALGPELRQVTGQNLGLALDVVFLDGYFVTTDGEFLVTGNLGDPDTIPVLGFQSSEIDPDPVVGLLTLRNEVVALNRFSIEFFDNVGGDGLSTPLRRIEGAQIEKGLYGRNAKCIFDEKIAFVGGGHNEQLAVYLGVSGNAIKISTHEIDKLIRESIAEGHDLPVGQPPVETVKLEALYYDNLQTLMLHLPTMTLCYDLNASNALQRPVWYKLVAMVGEARVNPFVNAIRVHDQWMVGGFNSGRIGYLTDAHSRLFGDNVDWSFSTPITYNQGNGFSVYEVKLQGLTGRAAPGDNPIISTQFSNDSGRTWSRPKPKNAGLNGEYRHRLEWARQGDTDEVRIQRFFGDSDAHVSFSRMDAQIIPSEF